MFLLLFFFFFFNDTATTEIYTLSLHDALPIYAFCYFVRYGVENWIPTYLETAKGFSFKESSIGWSLYERSEEHTSELQSQSNLVCRLLLEKKKKRIDDIKHQACRSDKVESCTA